MTTSSPFREPGSITPFVGMDVNKFHSRLAEVLQVDPAKLRLEATEGGCLLYMPDHRFALAKARLEEDGVCVVEPENGHPVEGEEGLFHHARRDEWLVDEIRDHDVAVERGEPHFHPHVLALREARAKTTGKGVGRIRFKV